jgi:large subunit ribosomal protein L21
MAEKTITAKKAAPKKKIQADGMFAVIWTGGKQYKVSAGDSITIEKLGDNYKEGDVIDFDKVLLKDSGADTTIGVPYVEGASVQGVITKIGRAPKVTVIKYKQKSRYFKKNGHRQPFFKVSISAIN